ncbi:MAG: hypothetical protein Q7R96_02425 [Nanoarchaeota archaeon]|nr:hypothetical protein [Nanoarchaeota archaeon]
MMTDVIIIPYRRHIPLAVAQQLPLEHTHPADYAGFRYEVEVIANGESVGVDRRI